MHPARLDEAALLKQCQTGKSRGSGPGGQHRNKVETLVWFTHVPTGLESHAGERRSAVENRQVALKRLRLLLAVKHRAGVPAGDSRSELWRTRCTAEGRISCNPEHHDFPALLAEAMDMLDACGLDVKKGAVRLCCSPSQLVKLLKDHPPALEELNRRRAERGLRPLK
jgi:RF-1 domain